MTDTPERPRIARQVSVEAFFSWTLVAAIVALAWNFLVVPFTPIDQTLHVLGAIGGAFVLFQVFSLIGYAVGQGIARQTLAANEQYAEEAAAYLEAVDEEQAELEDELAGTARGGQG